MSIFDQIASLGSNFDPIGSYQQGLQFRNQQILQQFQMSQMQNAIKQKEMLGQLGNQLSIATPEARNGILARIALAGDPTGAMDAYKMFNGEAMGGNEYGINPVYGKDAQGNTVLLQLSKAGGVKQVTMPEGVSVSRNLTWRDLGNEDVAFDPTGTPVVVRQKGLAPTQTSSYLRSAEQAKATGRGEGEAQAGIEKRKVTAQSTLDLIKEARSILPKATGSYLGKGRDVVAGAVGESTEGAQIAARLKVIAGNLTMSQPRMEGPQSDRDTMLYREMAGQVGDDTLPAKTRLAALEQIERLQSKYAGQNGQTTQPAANRPPLSSFGAP